MADRSRLRIQFAGVQFEASTMVATGAAILTLIAGLLTLIKSATTDIRLPVNSADTKPVVEKFEKELSLMRSDISRLSSELEAIRKVPSDSRPAAEIITLTAQVGGFEKRLTGMESAVLESPDKVLAVPMLRKDIDNLRTSYQSEILAAREEVNRLYDLNKWFIGLMITMAIGILGLALGNVVQGRRDSSTAKTGSG